MPLSVVIPAYNEEARLGATMDRLLGFLRERFSGLELIVVDDGSTDGTARLVQEAGAPEVKLIRLERNRGKGFAVRRGMLEASGDPVLFTDADLSTPIEELEKALACLSSKADVAIASRSLPGSDVQVRQTFLRESMGKTFNFFVRIVSGLPFIDTQCGFKCFTRAAARAIFSRATLDSFAFDVEALMIAKELGLNVRDFPVRWRNSPDSRVRLLDDSTRMLVDLTRLRLRRGAVIS